MPGPDLCTARAELGWRLRGAFMQSSFTRSSHAELSCGAHVGGLMLSLTGDPCRVIMRSYRAELTRGPSCGALKCGSHAELMRSPSGAHAGLSCGAVPCGAFHVDSSHAELSRG
eukprot:15056005-Alexandrium_andersonii.AAC.1